MSSLAATGAAAARFVLSFVAVVTTSLVVAAGLGIRVVQPSLFIFVGIASVFTWLGCAGAWIIVVRYDRLRHAFHRSGTCRWCRYDLRATAGFRSGKDLRCPECGRTQEFPKRTLKKGYRYWVCTWVSSVTVIALGLYTFRYGFTWTFRPDVWKNPSRESDRARMVDDLLKRRELVGMTNREILSLLGPGTTRRLWPNLAYCMGPEVGWFGIDDQWLVFEFDENSVVESVFIGHD